MKIDFTLRRFPVTGSLKQQCGLPFSIVIQPFAKVDAQTDEGQESEQELPSADDIVRCKSCFAYVNCYSSFSSGGWTCSLCGKFTGYKPYIQSRYQQPAPQLARLPEVRGHAYEAVVGEPVAIEIGPKGFSGPAPVYIALVDVGSSGPGGGQEFVELVRSSLEAALEALSPAALFGLITFSDKLALHDLRSPTPTARILPLQPASSSPSGLVQALLPLAEVMPLKALLAPVALFKDRITEALEALVPHAPAPAPTPPPPGAAPLPPVPMTRAPPPAPPGPCRALGPALLAVLDYLKALQHPPFLAPGAAAAAAGRGAGAGAQAMADMLPPASCPVHLMLFLSGPPDLGPGRVVSPSRGGGGATAAAVAEAGLVRAAAGGPGEAAEQLQALALGGGAGAGGAVVEPSPEARRFYEAAAVAAAALGACVDVYAVSPGQVGLPALEPLANSTGGAMYLYPSAEESALPQDVYRRLSCPRACSGLLRVRTSPGFKPVRFYGRLFPDRQFDSLHHVISCDASDTFAVDLEHTHKTMGFAAEDVVLHPTVQVVFQYTTVVSLPAPAAAAAPPAPNGHAPPSPFLPPPPPPAPRPRLALERRLRVVTLRMSVTRDPMDLYRHCSTDAVLCLLMHKVAKVTAGAGAPLPLAPAPGPGPSAAPELSPQLGQARVLLRDWLVLLVAGYQVAKNPRVEPKALAGLPLDLDFSEAPALQRLPRLVYALFRSPLLAAPPEGQHPDLTPFIRHLWACLPPGELQAAVYPALSSWLGPDVVGQPQHPLSRSSIHSPASPGAAPPPLFLLDAYIVILVLYTAAGAGRQGQGPAIPFPPPQGSGLARAISSIRQGRRISPRVRYVREGSEDAELFFQLLLDEPELGGGPEPGGGPEGEQSSQYGLQQFLEHIRGEVALHLGADAQQT